MDPVIDTTEIAKEIGARIREELDYRREAKHVMLYRKMLDGIDAIRVPRVRPELSTGRLLTLDWLQGRRLLEHTKADLATRNRLGTAMFTAWWWPFSRFGVIHGDPHLGNYSVFDVAGGPAGINLLDYGCIRIFAPKFVGGVVDLYHGLLKADADLIVHAYETWGFKRLNRELIDAFNIWARFIYGPLLDDRVRSLADGVKPSEYGRREAFRVHQALKQQRSRDGAARIRIHGPRRDRARRACFCICAPSSTSTDCSMKPSRTLQSAASAIARPRRSRRSVSTRRPPSGEAEPSARPMMPPWRPRRRLDGAVALQRQLR